MNQEPKQGRFSQTDVQTLPHKTCVNRVDLVKHTQWIKNQNRVDLVKRAYQLKTWIMNQNRVDPAVILEDLNTKTSTQNMNQEHWIKLS